MFIFLNKAEPWVLTVNWLENMVSWKPLSKSEEMWNVWESFCVWELHLKTRHPAKWPCLRLLSIGYLLFVCISAQLTLNICHCFNNISLLSRFVWAFGDLPKRLWPGRRYSSAESYIGEWCHHMRPLTLSWTWIENLQQSWNKTQLHSDCTQMSPAMLTHSAGAWQVTQRTWAARHLNAHLFHRVLWP